MKKYPTKPVVAIAASALLLAGAAPLLADANASAETPHQVKVVMNDQGEQVLRYRLQDLAQNDPEVLNMLLKNQAGHLYIRVDELGLNAHLQTYMQEKREEFERVYNRYYGKIWLEVRYPDAENAEEIISVKAETKSGKVYVKGIVAPAVTSVKVVQPSGDAITVKPTSEHTFAVSFMAVGRGRQITVEAYNETKLVDRREVKVLAEDGGMQREEREEKVVAADAIGAPAEKEPPVFAAGGLTGTAVFDAKTNKIQVKGKLAGYDPKAKVSLAVLDPAGVKKTVKPNAHGDFTINISLNGSKSSFAGDAVILALYMDGKQILEKKIPVEAKKPEKRKKAANGQAYGDWKNKGNWTNADRDEDDDGEDDDGRKKGRGKDKRD